MQLIIEQEMRNTYITNIVMNMSSGMLKYKYV